MKWLWYLMTNLQKRRKSDPVDLFENYKGILKIGIKIMMVKYIFNWNEFLEQDEDRIGPDGIERLCKDLDISPTSITILILAWKMGAGMYLPLSLCLYLFIISLFVFVCWSYVFAYIVMS